MQINCNLIFYFSTEILYKLKYALDGCYKDKRSILLYESMMEFFKVNVTAT